MVILTIYRSISRSRGNFRVTVALLALALGCEASTAVPVIPAPTGQVVSTPQYVNWSQFPVGTVAIREKVVTNPAGSISVTTTQRLIRKNEREAVVEQQSTVVRPEGKTEEPSQEFVFPATFRLPPNLKEEQFALPSFKAKLTGKEQVRIGDGEFDADVYEWEEVNEAGPMKVKIWRSPSIPGQTIREMLNTASINETAVEELKSFNIPQP